MNELRLLVCGGRYFCDGEALRRWMNEATVDRIAAEVVVIHGGARGADYLAGEIARQAGVRVIVCPADWSTHGAAAGPIRNQAMLDDHAPTLVLAAPGGDGTNDMVRRARRAGIPIIDKRGVL